ncbi:hypothetical protein SAMN05444580_10196 [Rhodococcus tukisamuensis]|uniref:Uncharacterized protein n=1 Tax=Rhodococcus tukisamuensis TaxID=168276 RepID=A0A1G6M8X8_9NOCA|nr:hypothetical protein SAMN05444580_10196 [Rhodococcus tukisamuensis]
MRVTAQGECEPAAAETRSGTTCAPSIRFLDSGDILLEYVARTRKLRNANISHAPVSKLSAANGA